MKPGTRKPAIVLVHGAFADGSEWSHVIPLLERDGYEVAAVQNHLVTLADDVATTRRVVDTVAVDKHSAPSPMTLPKAVAWPLD